MAKPRWKRSTVLRSSNNLRIAITPHRVGVVSSDGITEYQLATSDGLPCAAELEAVFKEIGTKAKARLTLSQSLATVWLLPAPPVMLRSKELGSWVLNALEEKLGERMQSYALTWDVPPPGSPILACGTPALFMQTLKDAMGATGQKADCVEPWLAVSYRECKTQLAAKDAWLGLLEPGNVTIAKFSVDGIQTLRSAACVDHDASESSLLKTLLQRELLFSGSSEPCSLVLRSAGLPGIAADMRGMSLYPESIMDPGLKAMLGIGHA